MNKLVVLILLLAGAWFFREPLERAWDRVKGIVPRVRTEMDMRGYVEPLRDHIDRRGAPPEDLAAWIDNNNSPKGPGQPASLDRYGNPYQVSRDRERRIYILRSCGRDGKCFTDDDLLVDIPNP